MKRVSELDDFPVAVRGSWLASLVGPIIRNLDALAQNGHYTQDMIFGMR